MRFFVVCLLAAAMTGSAVPSAPCAVTAENVSCGARLEIVADDETFTYVDADITPSDFTVREEIERRRINAPLDKKTELVDEYLKRGADYKTALSVPFPLLPETVEEVKRSVYVPPVDSVAEYKNGAFYATHEKNGYMLDEESLYASIYYCLKYGKGGSIKAHTLPVKPQVTSESLSKRLKLRSEYTTDYTHSSMDRMHNVALALSKLDGIKIAAGETLSFNRSVGERSERNGYKNAKIIVDGKYVDGVGGGACQASTALYNAALTAGLSCCANSHTICPSYCPPGLDAMISSFSDLTVTNTTGEDVYISATSGGGKSTVRIFGAPREYTYVPESVVLKTLPHGETEEVDEEMRYFDGAAISGDRMVIAPGRDGYESETYLNYIKDGKTVKRVLIRRNVYTPTPRITVLAP